MPDLFYYLCFMIASALFKALHDIHEWNQSDLSWLPYEVFYWETRWKVFNAPHTYAGLMLFLYGYAMHLSPFPNTTLWKLLEIYLYFQVFNVFFHVVLRSVGREFPFFRFIWGK